MLLRTRALLLGLLLLPGAQAAQVAGDLLFPRGLDAEGALSLSAGRGALDLAPSGSVSRGVVLRFSGAEGHLVTTPRDHRGVDGVFSPYAEEGTPRNESFSLPAGTLENLTCLDGCRVLLYAAGERASLSLSGRADGALAFATEARVYAKGPAERPARDAFLYRAEPGWALASARPVGNLTTLLLAASSASAEGDLALYVREARAEWRSEDGAERRSLRVETTREAEAGAPGVPLAWREQVPFLVLRLKDARLVAPPDADVLLMAPAPSLDLQGSLRADEAEGVLLLDGARHALARERLEVEGRLVLLPAAEASRLAPAALAPATAVPVGATISGEATRVLIEGRPVPLGDALPVTGTAALVTGVSLAGLVAALVWLKLAGLPFYMRLSRASMLRNGNRQRIHDLVAASPGITAAELVRRTGLPEMVVRHHVRMLEAHGYLVVRGSAKVRGFFVADGPTEPEDMPLHLALKDATRRRIAVLLADAPSPRTQAELAEAAGVSRRLVSHHLARLEKLGLVDASGSTPRAYAATPRLLGVLRAAASPA